MNNLLIRLTAPFIIWFVHLSIVYGTHAGLCSAGQTGSAHSTIIALATIGAMMAIIAVFAIPFRSSPERTSDRIAVSVASGLALLAVIWTSLPALFLEACL